MTTDEKIKEIHASKLYGTFVEMGCGVAISNALLSVEGASNTIEEVSVPYSKELQDKLFSSYYPGFSGRIKSVSKEFVLSVVRKITNETIQGKQNFLMVASFQLQSEKNTDKLTHGYIAVFSDLERETDKPFVRVYHISIPSSYTRKNFLNLIGEVGIDIMYSFITKTQLKNQYIDQVWKTKIGNGGSIWETTPEINETLEILNGSVDDNFIVVTPDKQLIRFEDLVRDKPGIILLKGSFNPIHEYHVLMMEDTKKTYPDYASGFLCSITRYDKPNVSIEELLTKIDKITGLGYYMIISKEWRYADTVEWIRQRWAQPIIFPVGIDTLNRIIESTPTLPFENTKFLAFKRLGVTLHEDAKLFKHFILTTPSQGESDISSTKIRNGELKSTI